MTLTTNRRIPRQRVLLRSSFDPIRGHGILSRLADVAALVVGLTTSATVSFVGDLPVSEIIMLALLPIMLVIHGRRILKSQFKILFFMLGLWLFGQVISDIYRHSETSDWMRGDAAIIFFGLDILGLIILLSKNDRRKIILIAGVAVGSILLTFIHPSDYALYAPWKFGYASGVISLTTLISCFFYARRRYIIAGLLILSIVGVNLFENYRSPVGQLLMVIALVFPVIPEKLGRMRVLPSSGGGFKFAVLLGLVLGAIWGAGRLVDFATSAGLVSEEAKEKNETQQKAGSLLLAGRPEYQVSIQAVKDSPILGYGSWAHDPKYMKMLFDIELEQGLANADDTSAIETDVIPTHSHLMGAWVWAGIFGAVFWFYSLWLVIKSIISIATHRPPLAPVYMYMVISLFWSILFSPGGAGVRVSDALVFILVFDLLEAKNSAVKPKKAMRREVAFRRSDFREASSGRWNVPVSIPGRRLQAGRTIRFSR